MPHSEALKWFTKRMANSEKSPPKAKSKPKPTTATPASFGSRAPTDTQPSEYIERISSPEIGEFISRKSRQPAPPATSTNQSIRTVQDHPSISSGAEKSEAKKFLAINNDWIESFEGKRSEDPDEWLRNFEWIAESCNWDAKIKIIQFRRLMKGTARNWFESLADNAKQNFEELLREFKFAFRTERTDQYFMEVKQEEKEEIEDYLYRMLRICKRTNSDMSNVEKMNYFVKGLHPKIRVSVLSKKVKSLEEAVEVARKKQHTLHIQSVIENEEARPRKKAKTEDVSTVNQVSSERKTSPYQNESRSRDYRNRPRYQNQFRPYSYNQSWKRYDQDDWRTVGGRPICRACKRVGHTWKSCTEKKPSTSSTPRTTSPHVESTDSKRERRDPAPPQSKIDAT